MEEHPDRSTIGEYLTRLAEKPELVEAFLRNPERAMQEAGLSEPDRDLILQGKATKVLKSIRQQFGAGAVVAFMVWPVPWPPGPPC